MTVLHGDCLAVMPTLAAESVDAIVSDPPYGLLFMGKQWDHGVPGVPFWAEALRVAKPGAHLVAFGGTRTYHRLTCAIEDAGWDIRDCLSWLYGSGFPKSHDVSKAMDKAAGAVRDVVGPNPYNANKGGKNHHSEKCAQAGKLSDITSPATDLAREWQGWGTALKPAHEMIVLARKPLMGTVAKNVTAHGTGALNVDGCRIASSDKVGASGRWGFKTEAGWNENSVASETSDKYEHTNGRWPANAVLDEEAASLFPESRFFYTAKASRREREAGLEGMPEGQPIGGADKWTETDRRRGEGVTRTPAANLHPTVKPIALMRWLCRLVTPKGGLILDPFTGSGTTGCAAVLEGFRFVGIEREAEYVAIAEKRIAHWAGQQAEPDLFT